MIENISTTSNTQEDEPISFEKDTTNHNVCENIFETINHDSIDPVPNTEASQYRQTEPIKRLRVK